MPIYAELEEGEPMLSSENSRQDSRRAESGATSGVSFQTLSPRSRTGRAARRGTSISKMAIGGDQEPECCSRFPPWLLIDHEDSRFLHIWEVYVVVLLIVITVTSPFETAFIERDPVIDALFIFNTVIDISFFIDLIMQFFIIGKDEHQRPLTFPCGIAKNYLKGWFVVDVLSIIPVDAYCIMSGRKAIPGASSLKAVKIARLLRLMRLIRLAKFQRIARRWHTNVGTSYAMISGFKYLVSLVTVSHLFACIWGFTAMQKPCGSENWLSGLTGEMENCDRNPFKVYMLALYWAIMTLTSIGYGDIVPLNTEEYIICTICMMFMAGMWAYAIGAMCSVVATMHPQDTQFRQDIDGLNEFMEDFAMPDSMKKKMRKYFYESREVHRHRIEKKVLNQLSPALQGEVLLHIHKKWISKVWYFSSEQLSKSWELYHHHHAPGNSGDTFIVAAARRLDMFSYASDEEVNKDRTLCIVRRGLCARASNTPFGRDSHIAGDEVRRKMSSRSELRQSRSSREISYSDGDHHEYETETDEGLTYCERLWPRIYGESMFWGEDMLLVNRALRDEAKGRALSYLEIITLEASHLVELLPRFPEVHHLLCRARTTMALSRAMRKISWHLRVVRSDAEKEKAFMALDQDQVKDLIADMLRGDNTTQWVAERNHGQSSHTLVRAAHHRKTPRTLEGAAPAPKQQSHVLGRLDHMQGQLNNLAEAQASMAEKLDHVLNALSHQKGTNGSTADSSLKTNSMKTNRSK